MASFKELNLTSRLFMMSYGYKRYHTTPCAPLQLPLSRCRVALITTAGFYLPEQQPFDKAVRSGDFSYREIPNTVATQTLYHAHKTEIYHESAKLFDPNLVFPLDRFRELEDSSTIGGLNHRHFSFMGSILQPRQLIVETAPEVARHLVADNVDIVFLTPF